MTNPRRTFLKLGAMAATVAAFPVRVVARARAGDAGRAHRAAGGAGESRERFRRAVGVHHANRAALRSQPLRGPAGGRRGVDAAGAGRRRATADADARAVARAAEGVEGRDAGVRGKRARVPQPGGRRRAVGARRRQHGGVDRRAAGRPPGEGRRRHRRDASRLRGHRQGRGEEHAAAGGADHLPPQPVARGGEGAGRVRRLRHQRTAACRRRMARRHG